MPARLFHMDAEKPIPVLWTDAFGEMAFGRLRISSLGIPWVVLRSNIEDGKPSTLGLAVTILQPMWNEGSIEIEKLVKGEWIEIDESDWGAFNAKEP